MRKYESTHLNEPIVLEHIINNNKISRSKLAKTTDFKKSSISDITKTLLNKSIIFEDSLGSSSNVGGRRPIFLKFNSKCSIIIAIEIGKNYIKSYLTYINGEVIDTINYKHIDLDKTNIISLTESVITKLSANVPYTPYGIVGVGIAIHGTVFNNKISFTPYSNIDEINFHEEISRKVEFPILLINEANAAALGEYTFGTHYENLININIGDGIGAGIVEKGNLFIGKHGNAGEIGHTILFPHGLTCPCGNKGCVEQYASMPSLFKKLYKNKQVNTIDYSDVKEKWYNNNKDIINILTENVKYISISVNNIVTTYDPGVVIINNELYREIPELIYELKKNLTNKNIKNTKIKISNLKGNSTLFGCVSIVAQDFLQINKIKFYT